MANPSQRAKKMHDLAPKDDFVKANTRGKNAEKRGVDVVRALATKSTASAASASEIDPDKPLTEKQKAFVQSWAKGNSIGRACLDAGYADDGLGYRLARMPNVLALKAEYAAAYEATAEMSRKQVLDGIKEAIDMAKLMADPANMIAGWREVGKLCGYYAPVETRVKLDVTGNVTMRSLTAMTDAELLELIEKGKQLPAPAPLIEDVSGT
jgi:phage terminase small subunit